MGKELGKGMGTGTGRDWAGGQTMTIPFPRILVTAERLKEWEVR